MKPLVTSESLEVLSKKKHWKDLKKNEMSKKKQQQQQIVESTIA